jgi:hypothetical protein
MRSIFTFASKLILWLLAFAILREEARRRYLAGVCWPYASDPALAGPNSFCNVRREDDRGSRAQADFVRGRYGGRPEYWPAAFAYRAFNHVGVGAAFFTPGIDGRAPFDAALAAGDVAPLRATLRALPGSHIGHAYQIRGLSLSKEEMSVDDQLLVQIGFFLTRRPWREFFDVAVRRPELLTLEGAVRFVRRVPGIGPFLGAQVIADWKYAAPFDPEKTSDWWDWATIGPGSEKGMNIILGRPLDEKWKGREDVWLAELRRLLPVVNHVLAAIGHAPVHAQDLQNCLCELAKVYELTHGLRDRNKDAHYPAPERIPIDEPVFARVATEVFEADRAVLLRAGFPTSALLNIDDTRDKLRALWLNLRCRLAHTRRSRVAKTAVQVGAPLIDM